MEYIILYIMIFLIGISIGSFLNVCIYRIPEKEDIVLERSHCMSCGNVLKWYELIPLFSFIVQGGKCRNCKAKLSVVRQNIEPLIICKPAAKPHAVLKTDESFHMRFPRNTVYRINCSSYTANNQ